MTRTEPTRLAPSRPASEIGRLLYRVGDAADKLSVSRSKVYELMASGALRSVKIDRTRLIRDVDLREFVDSMDTPSTDHR